MSEVVVFTKPGCPPCNATLRRFDDAGVTVIEKSAEEFKWLIVAMGHMQAPVVMTGVNHWHGYRPDLIDEAIEARRNT